MPDTPAEAAEWAAAEAAGAAAEAAEWAAAEAAGAAAEAAEVAFQIADIRAVLDKDDVGQTGGA